MPYLVLVVGLYVLEVLADLAFLVDRMPCIFPHMAPFCVYSYSGGNLVTLLMLMSGQVRKFPRWMDLRHVSFVGNPDAA